MTIFDDVRHAFRLLAKSPGFASVAILALALGIGVNTTIFTLVNAVLFRGLPFEDSHRILHLENNNLEQGRDSIGVSYPDFLDWKAAAWSFESLQAFTDDGVSVADSGHLPERYSAYSVTADAFRAIGQEPLLGRSFQTGEDQQGAEPVAILGFALWTNRYGSDPDILGRSIRINEGPTTVVGIMPEGMRFPLNADLWLPAVPPESWQSRDRRFLEVYGKLKEGVTLQEAQAEMDALAARLQMEHPETNQGFGIVVKPYNDEFNGGEIRLVFLTLLGAVGFVLLIACANVANLLLARASVRKREISVRAALGAGRWRIIRQLLTESALLSSLGGLLGLGISFWGVRMFDRAVADVGKPYWIQFTLDGTVMAFFAAICLGTAFLFGLAPAIQASRTDLNESLKEGRRGSGGGSSRLSRGLVAVELALAMVLLVGAGLMIRSAINSYGISVGIETDHLLTMRISLPQAKYPDDPSRIAFYEGLQPRLYAIPGVRSASIASSLPLNRNFSSSYQLEGQTLAEDQRRPSASLVIIGDHLVSTLGMSLLGGRLFEAQDGLAGSLAAIVNRRFAEANWKDQDPLGQRLKLGSDEEWTTVVGVVSDVRHNGPSDPLPSGVIYVPYRQEPASSMNILARTSVPPEALIEDFRRTVRDADSDLPVYSVATMEQVLYRSNWPYRVFSSLFGVFAAIALILSSVGIYAVVSYGVAQRTQEIGLRMALGARGGRVVRQVLRQAAPQLAIGLVLGFLGAFGLSRILASLLVQVTPSDPWTFAGVGAILLLSSLGACLIPARRASRVDPIEALRME